MPDVCGMRDVCGRRISRGQIGWLLLHNDHITPYAVLLKKVTTHMCFQKSHTHITMESVTEREQRAFQ